MSSQLLNYRPSHSAVYYTPPKRLDMRRTLIGFAGVAVLVIVGAVVYAKVLPELEHLLFRGGAVIAAAGAIGLGGFAVVRYGKVYGPVLAASIGACLSLLALYAMWVTWLHDVICRWGAVGDVDYWPLVRHPLVLWRLQQHIGAVGTWKYDGKMISGVLLWIIWLGEAGIMLSAGVFCALKTAGSGQEICRECGAGCNSVGRLPRFAADCQEEMVGAIEGRDFASLASHPAPQDEDAPELALSLLRCSRCGQTHILTLNLIAWTINAHGQATVKVMPLVHRLLISHEEAADLQAVCQQIVDERTRADAAIAADTASPADEASPSAERGE